MILPMRVLFITLEFSSGTFSGNGVLAQDQVRSLAELGHHVLVISAKPQTHVASGNPQGARHLIEIPVSIWGRLDIESAWMEFQSRVDSTVLRAVSAFAPDVILGVDWSSFPVYQRIRDALQSMTLLPFPPFVWSSYRVFTRTASDDNAYKRLRWIESKCFAEAKASIVLCKSDQDFVRDHFGSGEGDREPVILFPHIRQDVVDIPPLNKYLTNTTDSSRCLSALGEKQEFHGIQNALALNAYLHSSRPYFTCCVRVSPEKEPHRFVDIVIEMHQRGLFDKFSLRPLMCGSFKTEYAQELKERLLHDVPSTVIIDKFLEPKEMAELYSRTRLNVHPCTYDAYGMTIVEAASQEAPSIVHKGNGVGASDFLRSEHSELFEVDYTREIFLIVDQIEALLEDDRRLYDVGRQASQRARQYTAAQNAKKLQQILANVIDQKRLAVCEDSHSLPHINVVTYTHEK